MLCQTMMGFFPSMTDIKIPADLVSRRELAKILDRRVTALAPPAVCHQPLPVALPVNSAPALHAGPRSSLFHRASYCFSSRTSISAE
jgi:hypothetical protein